MSDALASFGSDLRTVVIGASGGLGRAFVDTLAANPRVEQVFACARGEAIADVPKVWRLRVDLADEATVAKAAETIREQAGEIDLVLVASGILHDEGLRPERSWRALDPEALVRVFRINAVGPALAGKHLLPLLRRERKACFAALSARVGSISENRLGGWHAYRTSKAALNMLLRNLALELARRHPQALCIGLHPGTVDTGLSAPFQANVPGGKLFTPAFAAARLLDLIDHLEPKDSGRLFAWDGAVIPF